MFRGIYNAAIKTSITQKSEELNAGDKMLEANAKPAGVITSPSVSKFISFRGGLPIKITLFLGRSGRVRDSREKESPGRNRQRDTRDAP